MELISPSANDVRAYRRAVMQHGSGYDSDGYYVYNQEGEGIGSFFGNLFRSAMPVIRQGIKGIGSTLKPHIQKAAGDLVTTGSKRLLQKINEDKPKKRKRRRRL
jgi:hypothetical protein